MNEPIIAVDKLTKSYRLYARPVDRLKETLLPWKKRHTLYHALNEISFSIQKGDHLGIVGVNGAGKSTLLQILAGVLSPSSGTVKVNGRVAALLELGAGFNPELSGQENVDFHLRLMEIPRESIADKVAEVQKFADIGEYFYQPVKTYSSGMFVRVAFACAILTRPDILIVDEALSVGDIRFQKKCFDYMEKLRADGTTMILVTHDIYAAKKMATRMILLDHGEVVAQGKPDDVATQYFSLLFSKEQSDQNSKDDETNAVSAPSKLPLEGTDAYVYRVCPDLQALLWGVGGAKLLEMRIIGLQPPNRLLSGTQLVIECDYAFDAEALGKVAYAQSVRRNVLLGIRLDTAQGQPLADLASSYLSNELINVESNCESHTRFRFTAQLPELVWGQYFLSPSMALGTQQNFTPIFCYENLAMITYEPVTPVLGLFRPNFNIERL